eukprot:symbB.v1.2.028278.t1/scaffold2974.1/size67673/3
MATSPTSELNGKSVEELLKMQSEAVKQVLTINQAIARKSRKTPGYAPGSAARSLRSQTGPTSTPSQDVDIRNEKTPLKDREG